MRLSTVSRVKFLLLALAFGLFVLGVQPALADNGVTAPGTGSAVKNSLNPFLTVTQAGDYSAHGTGMRGTGSGAIVIGDIPAGATVTHAFLYWAILDNSPGPTFDNGVFNGTPITGLQIGADTDPCWPVTSAFAYRANVTALVNPGGNGGYVLTGFANGGAGPPFNEGATLVILYTHPAAVENRDIVLYNGADTIDESVASVTTTMTVPPVGIPGNPKTSYIVADGQPGASDETLFEGVVIDVNAFQGSDGLLWDTDTYTATIAPLVSPGETLIDVGLRRGSDCLTHVAQVFSASSSRVLPRFVTLSPPTAINPVDSSHTVTATVTGAFGQPAANVVVRFTVTGAVNTTGMCTTGPTGQCTFTYTGPALPGADVINAYADLDNDNTRDPGEPVAAPVTKTWVLPVTTPGCEIKITNGGWIIAANTDRASFGGNAKADEDGNVTGQEEYQDHGPVTPFNLHGNVLVIVCNPDGSATIFGEATIDGDPGHTYRIDVEDNGEPGKGMDTYRMQVDTYDSGEQVLQGGNVQIHQD
jgi:hypothetical protein